jgi:hypothetical protein
MKSRISNFALTASLIASLFAIGGCAQTPAAEDATTSVSARCEQTGSNLPRRECRSEVEVLKPTAIESLKGAERPTMRGN